VYFTLKSEPLKHDQAEITKMYFVYITASYYALTNNLKFFSEWLTIEITVTSWYCRKCIWSINRWFYGGVLCLATLELILLASGIYKMATAAQPWETVIQTFIHI